MIGRVVALGGPPGSGKSTAGRRVAEALGLTFVSAGQVFREEAAARGMDVEAFGGYAEAHPEVDRTLDERMQGLARPGIVLDGRVQGALCRRHGTPVYAVLVVADETVRAERVAGRDHQSVAEALARMRSRVEGERRRYRSLYGIDVDHEPADLTVDSTQLPPDRVAGRIVEFLRAQDGGVSP